MHVKALHERTALDYEFWSEHLQSWLAANVFPREDGGLSVYLQDVSMRREAEQDRLRLAMIVEASTDFIAYARDDGRVLYLNEAGLRMVGLDRTRAAKTRVLDYLPSEWQRRFTETVLPEAFAKGHWGGGSHLPPFRDGGPLRRPPDDHHRSG